MVLSIGRIIFNKTLNGLEETGADILNSLQLLYLLKKLGPITFDKMFTTEIIFSENLYKKPNIPTNIFDVATLYR